MLQNLNTNMKRCVIILYLFFQIFLLNAQNEQIEIVGRFEKSKILLRWAPSNHIDWLLGNKYGYKVWKFTLTNGKQIIEKPDSVYLGLFKPALLDNWQQYSDSSTFAVAAQTIYGDSLEVQTTSNGILNLINKSREQESRFSFGMICADQSYTVAKLMGLALVDTNINSANMYGYKVELNYSDSIRKLLDGYLVIDSKSGNFLPHPFGITSQVYKNIIFIRVPFEPIKGYYSNFDLEKSLDNKSFATISGSNYYSVSTTNDDPYYYVFTDTIRQGFSNIYYRVKGKTLFDIYGPYSDTLRVEIKPNLNAVPIIDNLSELNDNLQVSWIYPDSTKDNLKGFKVFSSDDIKGPFYLLNDSLIDKSQTDYVVTKPADYKYFRVAAVDKFYREYFSRPRLYQVVDSTPPVQPKNFEGHFDSTGIVYFSWQRNPDSDILGYQLLYSTSKNSEFTLLNKGIVLDTVYSYPFSLNTLGTELYFKLVACDTRYNISVPSKIVEIVKPDTFPPSPPVLTLETDSIGNSFAVIKPSNSRDVIKHVITYTPVEGKMGTTIFDGVISKDTSILLNNYINNGVLKCKAVDNTNRYTFSTPISIKRLTNSIEKDIAVVQVTYSIDIEKGTISLKWNNNMFETVMIYKKGTDLPQALIGTFPVSNRSFTDENVLYNTQYDYKLIFIDDSGQIYTKTLSVLYR